MESCRPAAASASLCVAASGWGGLLPTLSEPLHESCELLASRTSNQLGPRAASASLATGPLPPTRMASSIVVQASSAAASSAAASSAAASAARTQASSSGSSPPGGRPSEESFAARSSSARSSPTAVPSAASSASGASSAASAAAAAACNTGRAEAIAATAAGIAASVPVSSMSYKAMLISSRSMLWTSSMLRSSRAMQRLARAGARAPRSAKGRSSAAARVHTLPSSCPTSGAKTSSAGAWPSMRKSSGAPSRLSRMRLRRRCTCAAERSPSLAEHAEAVAAATTLNFRAASEAQLSELEGQVVRTCMSRSKDSLCRCSRAQQSEKPAKLRRMKGSSSSTAMKKSTGRSPGEAAMTCLSSAPLACSVRSRPSAARRRPRDSAAVRNFQRCSEPHSRPELAWRSARLAMRRKTSARGASTSE
mmetsp:Transcript_13444/g.38222  ORF Transcript_13444/g.38222 Transcript_13444/m.38222 type:complete len:422 (-) Transcript_13444:1005-2270(-)